MCHFLSSLHILKELKELYKPNDFYYKKSIFVSHLLALKNIWPQSCSLGRYSVMQYQKQWYLAKYFLLLKYALQARFTSYFTHAHAYSTDIYIEPLLCARHSARSWRCGSEKDWQKSLSSPASETESSVFHLILFYILWGFGFPTLTREPSELFHWFRVFASKPCLLSFVLSCSFHSSYPESSLLKS